MASGSSPRRLAMSPPSTLTLFVVSASKGIAVYQGSILCWKGILLSGAATSGRKDTKGLIRSKNRTVKANQKVVDNIRAGGNLGTYGYSSWCLWERCSKPEDRRVQDEETLSTRMAVFGNLQIIAQAQLNILSMVKLRLGESVKWPVFAQKGTNLSLASHDWIQEHQRDLPTLVKSRAHFSTLRAFEAVECLLA